MYNIIIVDRQRANHQKIKKYIEETTLDCKIIGEVFTAEDAEILLRTHSIDLIIADDNLPIKTGLQLYNDNEETYPNLHMILLAEYNRFNNTKELMTGGRIDYLFKPIRMNDVVKSIMQMSHLIDESREHEHEQVLLRENYETNIEVFKDRFLINLIHGHIDNDKLIVEQFSHFKIPHSSTYVVGVMKIDQYRKYQLALDEDEKQFLIFRALNVIESYMTLQEIGFCFINRYDEICFIITENLSIEELIDHCASIQENLLESLNLSGTIGLGHIYSRPTFISVSYNQARAALQHNFYLGLGSIIHIDYVANNMDLAYYYPRNQEQGMIEDTVNGNVDRALITLKELYQALSLVETLPKHYFSLLVIEVLVNINRTASENNASIEDFFKSYVRLKEINTITSADMAYDYLKDAITQICQYQSLHREEHKQKLLNEIFGYVNTYYANKISLKRAAMFLKTTPQYLEKIIYEAHDKTFYDYCMFIRLNKAKEFLRTTKFSVADVATKVGFNNADYFSAIFRQHNNMTPSQYKEQVRYNPDL